MAEAYEARRSETPIPDEGFATDVQEGIDARRDSFEPPAWEQLGVPDILIELDELTLKSIGRVMPASVGGRAAFIRRAAGDASF